MSIWESAVSSFTERFKKKRAMTLNLPNICCFRFLLMSISDNWVTSFSMSKSFFSNIQFLSQWKKKWNSSSILLHLQKLQILRFRGTFFLYLPKSISKIWWHILNFVKMLRNSKCVCDKVTNNVPWQH